MLFNDSSRGIDNPSELPGRPSPHSFWDKPLWDKKRAYTAPLSGEALNRYQRHGFLWFENLFAGSQVMKELMAELMDFKQNDAVVRSSGGVVDPDTGILCSILGIDKLSEKFKKLTQDPLILGMVRQLLGSDVYLRQSRINDEDAYVGKGYHWETDETPVGADRPERGSRSIGVSLTLTDDSEFNGPLERSPAPHLYQEPDNGAAFNESDRSEQQLVTPTHGGAGTLLIYECNSFLLGCQNVSPWPNANALLIYNSICRPLNMGYDEGWHINIPKNLKPRERTPMSAEVKHRSLEHQNPRSQTSVFF